MKVAASTLVEKANKGFIDWCVTCIYQSIPTSDTNRLMFAYIFINMIRALGKEYYNFTTKQDVLIFSFSNGLLKTWDCPAVEKVKYNKRYYTFLSTTLRTYLVDQCADYEDRSFKIQIEQDTVKIYIE